MSADEGDVPDPSTPEGFGKALKRLRERAGLSVREVHQRTGIATGTLGDYFAGRHRPRLENLTQILEACGVDDPDEVQRWTDLLRRARRRQRTRAQTNPYRGLEPFRREDAEWFFGRSALASAVAERLLKQAARGLPLVVTGPSGSGKSSLLAAGVVPSLERDHGMTAMLCTPGELRSRPNLIGPPTDGARRLVVIDQFEELFAPGVDAQTVADVAELIGALSATDPVVIGLRADFYAAALRVPLLAAAVQASQVVVGPMTTAELREAVVGPAIRAGLTIEDGLVDMLLADLGDTEAAAGALPLLSHALMSTCERGDGRLTVAEYVATGGVRGAVARSAEEAVEKLGPDREDAVRQMFLRLVHVAPDVADTRRRAARDELLGGDAAMAEVLDAFIARRLVVAHEDRVEIAHEALLVAWPRLRSWIDADRIGAAAHRRLTEAALTWRDHRRDPEALLTGTRLAAATEWAIQPARRHTLNDLEREFLAASEERQRRLHLGERRRTRRLRRLLAATGTLLVIATVLGGYAVTQRLAVGRERDVAVSRQLAIRAAALREVDPSLAAHLAATAYRVAHTDEARSSLLDATARPLPTRLPGPPGTTQAVAVAGGLLATSNGSGPTVQLWRVEGAVRIGETPSVPGAIQSVALTGDGRRLAAGGADGSVTLFDLTDPARPRAVQSAPGAAAVQSIAFAPGDALYAGTADGRVRRFAVGADGLVEREPLLGRGAAITALAVAKGGLLAAGDADGNAMLWASPESSPIAVTGAGGAVYSVAFSPDGHTLAAGSADRSVHLWDVSDPAAAKPRAPLTGPTNWVDSVAFAPDGRTVAAGSSDGDVWLWEVPSGRLLGRLPHSGPVTAVAFADGDTLATGEADGVARLWPIPGPILTGFDDSVFALNFDAAGEILAVGPGRRDNAAWLWIDGGQRVRIPNPPGEPAVSGSLALTPDGRTLAVGRVDGSVRLWDVRDPRLPALVGSPLPGSALVEQLTTSRDGRYLAVSGDDNLVRLWDIADPTAASQVASLAGATSYVFASSFSPDGRLLAAASADTHTYLWDLVDPRDPRLLTSLSGPTSYAYSPAFSHDGRLLAVGSADKSVRLWDVSDPVRPRQVGEPLTGPGNYVYSVAFRPDGGSLAAASTDGTVWMWDLADPAAPEHSATLTGPDEAFFAVTWSPDGSRLLAGAADRTVRSWETDPERAAAFVCAHAGAPLDESEWARLVPDLPFDPACRT